MNTKRLSCGCELVLEGTATFEEIKAFAPFSTCRQASDIWDSHQSWATIQDTAIRAKDEKTAVEAGIMWEKTLEEFVTHQKSNGA